MAGHRGPGQHKTVYLRWTRKEQQSTDASAAHDITYGGAAGPIPIRSGGREKAGVASISRTSLAQGQRCSAKTDRRGF